MRQWFEIITAPLVERLEADKYPIRQAPARLYPDGSLLTEGWNTGNRIRDLLTAGPEGYGSFSFRPLAAFGGSPNSGPFYTATYPGWYAWMVSEFDEAGTIVGPGGGRLISKDDEYDLEHVRVMIKLYRKIGKAKAEEVAGIVWRWYTEIGSQGVFDEAGIRGITPVMRYRGRDVGFELDARGSGQETLNTLVLAVLNWAMATRQPLDSVELAAERYEKVFSSELAVPLVVPS